MSQQLQQRRSKKERGLSPTLSHRQVQYVVAFLVAIVFLANQKVFISEHLSFTTDSDKIIHSQQHRASFSKNVAIIGGAGYVGSYLAPYLRTSGNHGGGFHVTIFDKDPKIDNNDEAFGNIRIIKAHSRSLQKEDLSVFRTVIFLGGCTGRKACDQLSSQDVERENVSNVIDLMKKLDSSQHLIAASTSAVAEGTIGAKEDSSVNSNLLDSYSLSMFKREIRLKEFVSHDQSETLPQISLLRFGTVVGNSPSQRTDLMIPSVFRSAYTTGRLQIAGHNTMRSFLTLKDLADAFVSLISKTNDAASTPSATARYHYNVWNLASFDSTIFKVATTVSSLTGAYIDSSPLTSSITSGETVPLIDVTDSLGFSLNCDAFQTTFNFTFRGSLEKALLDFDHSVPASIIPKGPHSGIIADNDIVPCPVCGATGQQIVVDLGYQPLANDFFPDVDTSIARPRFPLKLVRCRVCNHYHLSHIVDRSDLFENYLYQSGTSATLSEYFEWLAQKVIAESDLKPDTPGSILEIACNDGSQLDHYKKKGWKTFGVDPAANLASLAALNHTVKIGFWPTEFPELPRGNDLTAITAQNVAAHVPDVVAFLKGCADVMGESTKLYIQTSQCNMQQLGQFDTVYHEHVSFFTGHSFVVAAELSGLVINSFETTPIHGESCLVTMQLDKSKNLRGENKTYAPSLRDRLIQEQRDGITSDFFAMKFSAHANMIREWVRQELHLFKAKGSIVGGYGAAAKGMVLLHFIIGDEDNGSSFLDFVLDDAKLKQGTFCPGTVIPVKPTSSILDLSKPEKQLVIVVFAWNFFDEIANKIIGMLRGTREDVLFLVPFPTPKVIRFNLKSGKSTDFEVLREFLYHPTPIPNPITHDENRTKAVMVTHQRNEEFLMPFFIMQHAPMFDKVLLIDFKSDDRTLEIIERFAPPSWEVITSSSGEVFDARQTDQQVMALEKLYPDDWIIALTTTEFLVKPHLRQYLRAFEAGRVNKESPFIFKPQAIGINGNNTLPLVYSNSLPQQRQLGNYSSFYSRAFHYKTSNTHVYLAGRHVYKGPEVETVNLDPFIMKFMFAPWPEVKERKMNIGKQIPEEDVRGRRGVQHTNRLNETYIENEYMETQEKPFEINLCTDAKKGDEKELKYKRVYNQMFGKCEDKYSL